MKGFDIRDEAVYRHQARNLGLPEYDAIEALYLKLYDNWKQKMETMEPVNHGFFKKG